MEPLHTDDRPSEFVLSWRLGVWRLLSSFGLVDASDSQGILLHQSVPTLSIIKHILLLLDMHWLVSSATARASRSFSNSLQSSASAFQASSVKPETAYARSKASCRASSFLPLLNVQFCLCLFVARLLISASTLLLPPSQPSQLDILVFVDFFISVT